MLTILAIIHLIVAVLIIIFVLLQDSKGGALGALGGGSGASTVWGSSGAGNILVTATRWLAIVFAVTCVSLAYLTTHKGTSVIDQVPGTTAPVAPNPQEIDTSKVDETAPAAAPVAPATTPDTK